MSLIYDHASKGTLTETHLSEGGLEGLEFVHPSQKLTPLGIAVWNGHTKSVELLLANGANPDGQPGTRPPLYVAVAKTRINVYPIVYALLNHGANPSLKSSIDGDTTPLLAAVKHGQSPSLVSVLVDAGASPRDEDAKGQTAEKWAEDRKNRELLHAMLPRASRSSNKLEAALMIAGLVLSVFAWTNKSTVVAGAATIAVGAAVSRRFKITGTFSLKPVCIYLGKRPLVPLTAADQVMPRTCGTDPKMSSRRTSTSTSKTQISTDSSRLVTSS